MCIIVVSIGLRHLLAEIWTTGSPHSCTLISANTRQGMEKEQEQINKGGSGKIHLKDLSITKESFVWPQGCAV